MEKTKMKILMTELFFAYTLFNEDFSGYGTIDLPKRMRLTDTVIPAVLEQIVIRHLETHGETIEANQICLSALTPHNTWNLNDASKIVKNHKDNKVVMSWVEKHLKGIE